MKEAVKVIPVEADRKIPLGIYNETDRLTAATVWGPIGVEAVLAQLLPEEKSLFLDKMDVPAARKESLAYARVLNAHGVETYSVRDRLAQILPPQPELTKDTVTAALIARAKDYQEQYGKQMPGYETIIRQLIDEDIARYGEAEALTLNKVLSLDPDLPLGNMLFARDQMNVLLGRRVKSSMAKPIRQPEVDLYELVYTDLGLTNPIELPQGETFEGGDAYIHNGIVYVGVGDRTTKGAAIHIFRELYPQLEENGLQFAIVEDEEAATRPPDQKMDFMHIDTFSAAAGETQIGVCKVEAVRRRIKLLTLDEGNLDVFVKDTGMSQLEFLQDKGEEILDIPAEEQKNFGANFLALDATTIIVPIKTNEVIIKALTEAGKTVLYVPLEECTNGYGGPHCMTGQLHRQAVA